MKRSSLARVALLLAIAAAGLGQSEDEPYFSLRSSHTFGSNSGGSNSGGSNSGGSNSAPNVALSASNVDSLDFRVYRINDPVQFFQQLEDPHEFGGSVPRPPHQPSFLETIHEWKSTLRATIRRSVRAQFTESPVAQRAPKRCLSAGRILVSMAFFPFCRGPAYGPIRPSQ